MAIVIEVATKDCTALSDAELAEMADLSADGASWLRGRLPLQAARGVGARHPGSRAGQAAGLRPLDPRADRRHAEPAHRRRLLHPRPTAADATLDRRHARPLPPRRARLPRRGRPRRHPPRPGSRLPQPSPASTTSSRASITRPTGEERAWGRRLAKRFGAEGQLDDRTFVITGDGDAAGLLDYDPQKAPARGRTARGPLRRRGRGPSRQPRRLRLGDGRAPRRRHPAPLSGRRTTSGDRGTAHTATSAEPADPARHDVEVGASGR